MKSYFPLLAALSLLTTTACEKDEVDALPKATQEGKNQMGCLVNGKAWKPYAAIQFSGTDPFAVYWRVGNGRVRLTMLFSRQSEQDPSDIYFYVPSISGAGTFDLDQAADPVRTSSNPAYAFYSVSNIYPNPTYLTGPTATGQLTITRFDTTARIVSGTFNFTGRVADGGTVEVSKGRFDMRLERR